eukprot:1383574-Amorphochlora_amoeboformis.AAC.1
MSDRGIEPRPSRPQPSFRLRVFGSTEEPNPTEANPRTNRCRNTIAGEGHGLVWRASQWDRFFGNRRIQKGGRGYFVIYIPREEGGGPGVNFLRF